MTAPRAPEGAYKPAGVVVVALPLPPTELRVNRRIGEHRAIHHRIKKQYQGECWMAVRGHIKELRASLTSFPVAVSCTIYVGKGQRMPDVSDAGAYVKVALDALVPEVFPNDSPRYIARWTADVGRDAANPRVELRWEATA